MFLDLRFHDAPCRIKMYKNCMLYASLQLFSLKRNSEIFSAFRELLMLNVEANIPSHVPRQGAENEERTSR